MAANQLIQTRIDATVKEEAAAVLAAIGLTVSDAVRLLLTKVAQEKALPFEPLIPNPATVAAMKEARAGKLAKFDSVDALTDDLHGDSHAERHTSERSGMRLPRQLSTMRRAILETAQALGAHDVRVFGSVARGEDRPDSDIDFLVTLEPGRTLMDLARLEARLEALLGRRVDVATETGLKEPTRSTVLREAIRV